MSDAKRLSTPVPPGGTIGILGGGQLGRMLAMAAARLGLKTHIYSPPNEDAPAFQVSDDHTSAAFDDKAALTKFAQACDVVTFEWENVPVATVEHIAQISSILPNAKTLGVTQDRFAEKSFIKSLGLATAPFVKVDSAEDAHAKVSGSAILKTRRMGYDGKGQAKVKSREEAARALETFKGAPCILEGFVEFDYEASVIAARDADGSFAAYDPPENIHEHHILRRSIVPSRLSAAQVDEAKSIARKIADALDYVGVFAVELFVMKDGSLLVNEIAPRVHNSGHWTIDACLVSQFENHIRAVAGWPLGSTERHSDAVMENLIGEEAADWQALAKKGGALHLYGKKEIRAGRKMGHVTYITPKTSAR
ncbi:MAG TPA: 5-(carboxyamino)imidazole ribonucleotide synthase [Rhizomicrobium sp.]|nr:5-(carboxyamino)imidazole ribonucleotide synthase [Rhizomicrobium sp.]